MGIVILPFLLATLIIGLIALVKSVNLIVKKEIKLVEVFYGFIVSILLYVFIALCYSFLDKAWALGSFFILPILMVFLPFLFCLGFEKSKNIKEQSYSKILLFSILITVIFSTLFYEFFFNIIENFGTKKSY